VLRRFLHSDLREIRILSRDEKKQDDMRKKYQDPKLKFYLGDVRDYQSVLNGTRCGLHLSRSGTEASALVRVPPWRP
jgi:FlaA1/EpsC-like NDP-sugar epimerase